MDREKVRYAGKYILAAIKWAAVSLLIGVVCGLLGTAFHWGIDWVTRYRSEHMAVIWLLPLAGVATLLLYRLCRVSFDAGTNLIITSVVTGEHIPVLLAPLITAGTLLSHLFGASVGREGAALQLGGTIGHNLGELMRFDEDDVRVLAMSGMAACFSAMFGTPVSAAVFVLEVICVGTFQYAAFLPCIIASCTAGWLGRLLGSKPMAFDLPHIPEASWEFVLKTALLAALTAALSIVLCIALHKSAEFWARLIKNPYLRIFLGGLIMAVLVTALGLGDYAGAGAHMIERAIGGETEPWAFAGPMCGRGLQGRRDSPHPVYRGHLRLRGGAAAGPGPGLWGGGGHGGAVLLGGELPHSHAFPDGGAVRHHGPGAFRRGHSRGLCAVGILRAL